MCDTARGLLNLGLEVTVVHNEATLMNFQLDKVAGEMLRNSLEAQGMRFLLSATTAEVLGIGRATGLRFVDGTTMDCDLVAMAAGIRPNKDLAEKARFHSL